jgi:hypothetical protein
LPDPFVAEQSLIDRWEVIHGRALESSTNDLMVAEVLLFMRTRLGATHRFIDQLNAASQKYMGKKFIDSRVGSEVSNIRDAFVTYLIKRVATLAGIALTGKLAEEPTKKVYKSIKMALVPEAHVSTLKQTSPGIHESPKLVPGNPPR